MNKVLVVKSVPAFNRTVKKLKGNQKEDLYKTIKVVESDPMIGQLKKHDIGYLRIYKFKMAKQLALLGYIYEDDTLMLTLMMVGPHENFYRDFKRSF